MKTTLKNPFGIVLILVVCLSLTGEAFVQDREAALIVRGKDDLKLVRFIRDRIIQTTEQRVDEGMEDYFDSYKLEKNTTRTELEMIALKGGEFVMGSYSWKKDVRSDEKPYYRVKVSPFWIGKYEVTWDLFYPYISKNWRGRTSPKRIEELIKSGPSGHFLSYDMAMEAAPDHPASSMTQNAANKFCQWLSYQTGHFYRLPTEAEWEYACRAGTTGAYSCPSEKLKEYAVFDPEQTRTGYEKVGSKKPNPWGIYDMHGNVMEWCLDQYDPLLYGIRKSSGRRIIDPFIRPNRLYPRVVRGGSWYDPAVDCRSTSRFYSHPNWQRQDPVQPKSIWILPNATWLGFRVVRPLKIPSVEEMHFIWNCGDPDFMKKHN